jgi:hypothetical protein
VKSQKEQIVRFFAVPRAEKRKCPAIQDKFYYSQTCVQRPPLGLEKSGRLKQGHDKSEIYTGR